MGSSTRCNFQDKSQTGKLIAEFRGSWHPPAAMKQTKISNRSFAGRLLPASADRITSGGTLFSEGLISPRRPGADRSPAMAWRLSLFPVVPGFAQKLPDSDSKLETYFSKMRHCSSQPTSARKPSGVKPVTYNQLYRARNEGRLAELHLTAGQLSAIRSKKGSTGLHLLARSGLLDQIHSGATAGQLQAVTDQHGRSALEVAVFNCLKQVKGGIQLTAGQLAAMVSHDGFTGLHAILVDEAYELVMGGITVEDLNGLRDDGSTPALLMVAADGHLDRIKGGVTANQLLAVKDATGETGLQVAARSGCLGQIKGGLSAEQMALIQEHISTSSPTAAANAAKIKKDRNATKPAAKLIGSFDSQGVAPQWLPPIPVTVLNDGQVYEFSHCKFYDASWQAEFLKKLAAQRRRGNGQFSVESISRFQPPAYLTHAGRLTARPDWKQGTLTLKIRFGSADIGVDAMFSTGNPGGLAGLQKFATKHQRHLKAGRSFATMSGCNEPMLVVITRSDFDEEAQDELLNWCWLASAQFLAEFIKSDRIRLYGRNYKKVPTGQKSYWTDIGAWAEQRRRITGKEPFQVNVTSQSKDPKFRELSPMFMGPVECYREAGRLVTAINLEVAWQYSKVFSQVHEHGKLVDVSGKFITTDDRGKQVPSAEWFRWRDAAYTNPRFAHTHPEFAAHKKFVRYPFPKGSQKARSQVAFWYWDGEVINASQARQKIYATLYRREVVKTAAFQRLREIYQRGDDLQIFDKDGYDWLQLGMTPADCLADAHSFGHGLVIHLLLAGINPTKLITTK